MIAKATIEMSSMAQGATRTPAQSSDAPAQPFSDSLLAASKTVSETGAANEGSKTTRSQKSTSDDAKAANAVSDHSAAVATVVPQQTTPVPQTVPAPQAPVSDTATTTTESSITGAVASSDPSTGTGGNSIRNVAASELAGIQSKNSQSGAVQTAGVLSGRVQWSGSAVPAQASLSGTKVQSAKAASGSSSKDGDDELSAVVNASSNAIAGATSNAIADASSNAVQNAQQSAAHSISSDASSNTPAQPAATSVPSEVLNAVSNAVASAVQNAVPDGVLKTVLNASSKAGAALDASAIAGAAQASSNVATKQTPATPAPQEQSTAATDSSVSGTIADQFAALTQAGAGLTGTGKASVSSLTLASTSKSSAASGHNATNGSKDADSDVTGLKQNAQSDSVQQGSQTSAQDATASGNQNQSNASPQGQNPAPVQVNFASHAAAAVAQVQNIASSSSVQTASTVMAAAGHAAAKTPDASAAASVPVAQALPVINTAKLIQSMGQTEMRVGMRSTEFGSISISTSATKDLITAQISLDHGELAKTLAASLPEMQARLGSSQAMDVRIDMNAGGTGQGTGSSGSMFDGSSDDARSGRQQSGSGSSSYSDNSVAGRQFSPAVAAMTTSGRFNGRLDITV
ncbi:MAG: hypothetical protein ABSE99_01525 [Terracidiphilus sp.]